MYESVCSGDEYERKKIHISKNVQPTAAAAAATKKQQELRALTEQY